MAEKITFVQAVRDAVEEELIRDEKVFYTGIDVRQSPFMQTFGLAEKFGSDRILNTPIAEGPIAGMALGAALGGMRPILEIMFADFLSLSMDHLYNNAGSWVYNSGGHYKVPLTVVTSTGGGMRGGYGHSQSPEPLMMMAPGWVICAPSNPSDAKGIMKSAIRSDNPVMVFQCRELLTSNRKSEVGDADYTLPFGKGKVVREGKDVTVVAVMKMVDEAKKAAKALSKEGIEVEIIDPITLSPLDIDLIKTSVKKTGRLVVAEESREVCGIGSEIISQIVSDDPTLLKAPARKVAAPLVPIPGGGPLEDIYLPRKDDILKAIKTIV